MTALLLSCQLALPTSCPEVGGWLGDPVPLGTQAGWPRWEGLACSKLWPQAPRALCWVPQPSSEQMPGEGESAGAVGSRRGWEATS